MIDRFINFFESLTFKKKMIFLIVTALILMMLTMIMANFSNGNNSTSYSSKIKYRSSDISSLLKDNFVENYDNRDDYIIIKNIVEQFGYRYNDDYTTYKVYYDAIDSNYKKHINKKNFAKKLNEIAQIINNSRNNFKMKMYINAFYENTYIVEIENEENNHYIGFQLDKSQKTYEIFYIE